MNLSEVLLGVAGWLACSALAAHLFGWAAHFHRRGCSICRSEQIIRADKRFVVFLGLLAGPVAVLSAVIACIAEYIDSKKERS